MKFCGSNVKRWMSPIFMNRYLSASRRQLSTVSAQSSERNIHVNFRISKTHETIQALASPGESVLNIALRENAIRDHLECICGGVAACATCHVIVDEKSFSMLEAPQDFEMDIIDEVGGQDRSRLGCQIKFSAALDGIELTVPAESKSLF